MRKPLVIAGLLLAQAFAAPAFSLTPDEVWRDWNTALDGAGIAVQAEVAHGDQQLVVRTLTLTLPDPEGAGDSRLSLGDIFLAPAGDGTVLVTLASVSPFTLATPGPDLTGSYAQEGFRMTVSGTPGQTRYAYDAQTLNLSIDQISDLEGDRPTRDMQPPITLIADSPSGQASLTTGTTIRLDQSSDVASLRLALQDSDPDVGELTVSMVMNSLKSQAQSQIDTARAAQDGPRAARTSSSEQSFQSAGMQLSFIDGSDSFYLQSDSQGGTATAAIDATSLSYDMTARDTTLGVRGSDIPFPVQSSIGQIHLAASGPTLPQDRPSPFSLRLGLQDVALPDLAWAILDSTGQLPHDPLSLDLALAGMGRLMTGDQTPEITALAVDQFDLRGLGAQVTAEGAFDADPAQRSRFGNYPKFAGQLDIKAKGVMAVIQTLTSTGILPPSVGFSSALYAGMFARQVSGPDDLATTLKVTPNEEIMINGQVISP